MYTGFISVLCIVCLMLHICCIVILATTNRLKKSRFKKLVLFLSISDIGTTTEVLLISLINNLSVRYQWDDSEIFCDVVNDVAFGTFMFSVFQALLICFERLNATLRNKNKCLEKFSSNKGIVISFLLFHLYGIVLFIPKLTIKQKHLNESFNATSIVGSCDDFAKPEIKDILSKDILFSLLNISVIIAYLIVICRIYKYFLCKSVMPLARNYAQKPVMRRTLTTLSVIIVITLLASVPRSVVIAMSFYTGYTDDIAIWMRITNSLIFLNPLFDPLVYIFCVKEFRDRLKAVFCTCRTNIVSPINPNNVNQDEESKI